MDKDDFLHAFRTWLEFKNHYIGGETTPADVDHSSLLHWILEGFVGFIFGHKFQGRYSTKESLPSNLVKAQSSGGHSIKEIKNHEKIYEGDVCIRCGMKIE